MRIRRPLAALMTSLALLGGGTATLAACGDPAGADRSDGTTDDTGTQDSNQNQVDTDDTTQENDEQSGGLPDNSDPEPGQDLDEDTQDPE